MIKDNFHLLSFLVLLTLLFSKAQAADYLWSVSLEGVQAKGAASGYPRAFLWIPSNCKEIRAVILSQNNMEEESILEDPVFRQTFHRPRSRLEALRPALATG